MTRSAAKFQITTIPTISKLLFPAGFAVEVDNKSKLQLDYSQQPFDQTWSPTPHQLKSLDTHVRGDTSQTSGIACVKRKIRLVKRDGSIPTQVFGVVGTSPLCAVHMCSSVPRKKLVIFALLVVTTLFEWRRRTKKSCKERFRYLSVLLGYLHF